MTPSRTRQDARAFAISIDELKAMLAQRVHSLCLQLLPNGREVCGYWRTGNLADEPGDSLAVDLATPGQWTDFAAARGAAERAGNLLQLIAMVKFRGNCGEAIKWARSWLGLDQLDPGRLASFKAEARARAAEQAAREGDEREKRRQKAHGLFLRGRPIPGTPAETYLRGRGIPLERLLRPDRTGELLPHVPNCLAFHDRVYNVEAQRELPAMLAAIVDPAGHFISVHRTWLAPDGRGGWAKAELEEPKKTLGGFGGGFIALWKGSCRASMAALPADIVPYVSEGIEDGLTAAIARPELRIVAAVSLGNMGAIHFPEQIREICLLAQRDHKPEPLAALEAAIAAQQGRGLEVLLAYPPPAFKDLNEIVDRRHDAPGRAAA